MRIVKVIIKGFIDPRLSDEMVLGEIEIPDDLDISTCHSQDRRLHILQFEAGKMAYGIGRRETLLEEANGNQESFESASGPPPDYPTPERDTLRCQAVPLKIIKLDV